MKRLLFIFFLFSSMLSFAQTVDPPEDQDDAIPIDGGISLLFGAGVAWGIKKLKDKK